MYPLSHRPNSLLGRKNGRLCRSLGLLLLVCLLSVGGLGDGLGGRFGLGVALGRGVGGHVLRGQRGGDLGLGGAELFGAPLFNLQMVQGHIADMALMVDAGALLVYRAAWLKDSGAPRVSREAAMAKLFATDGAQEVIDKAVQIHGGDGVRTGTVVESLYREIRALRIYEGTSEVQKLILAKDVLASRRAR